MDLGEGIHDALPVASGPPADEAVVAGRVRPKALGQIAPRCAGVQIGAAFDPQSAPKIFGAATHCANRKPPIEIANSVEAIQGGRIFIELINGPFCSTEGHAGRVQCWLAFLT
jgi:hypothetical protein